MIKSQQPHVSIPHTQNYKSGDIRNLHHQIQLLQRQNHFLREQNINLEKELSFQKVSHHDLVHKLQVKLSQTIIFSKSREDDIYKKNCEIAHLNHELEKIKQALHKLQKYQPLYHQLLSVATEQQFELEKYISSNKDLIEYIENLSDEFVVLREERKYLNHHNKSLQHKISALQTQIHQFTKQLQVVPLLQQQIIAQNTSNNDWVNLTERILDTLETSTS